MKNLTLFAAFCLIVPGAHLEGQTTVTLQCSRDAAIGFHDGANTAGNNYGGAIQNAAYFIPAYAAPVGSNGNRALIDFSLAAIPAGATILSAQLNLYALGPAGSLAGHVGTANASYLRRITQSWQEFSATWNNQPASTTQNQVTLPQSTSALQDYTGVNVTTLVQDMLNNPGSSHGFLLRLVNEVNTNGLLFASRNHNNQSLCPTLVIMYSICPDSVEVEGTFSGICSGGSAILTAQDTSFSYAWYASATGGSALGTGPVFVTPALTATGTPAVYTYYVAVPGCPMAPRTAVMVTVSPEPVIGVTGSQAICQGQAATLQASGANSYTWSTGATIPNITVTPSTTTTYSVWGTGAEGCTGQSNITVSVHPWPELSLAATSTLLCSGESVTLAATGGILYSWSAPQFSAIGNPVVITPASGTTVTLVGVGPHGCTRSTTIALSVNHCTGLDVPDHVAAFSVYPNPCHERLGFRLPANVHVTDLTIFNLLGASVRKVQWDVSGLDVSALEPGVYLCSVRLSSGQVAVRRFVVE